MQAGIFTKKFIKEKRVLGSYLCTDLFTGKKECEGTLPDAEAGKKICYALSSPHIRCIKSFQGWKTYLKYGFTGCTMAVQTFLNMSVKDSKYGALLIVKIGALVVIT